MSEVCFIFILSYYFTVTCYLSLREYSQLGSESTTVETILGALFDVTNAEQPTGLGKQDYCLWSVLEVMILHFLCT